jgi:hypothetical protein
MKKLFGAILLVALVAPYAVAQSDFASQYILKINGFAYHPDDLSSDCGSRIDIYIIYQDERVVQVYGGQHGGGAHYYNVNLILESKNKVKSIVCYGRVYRQGGKLEGCGSQYAGEGNREIKLDTTWNYPCYKQKHMAMFMHYDGRSETNVEIAPLSKKSARLVVDSDFRNNRNEDINDPIIGTTIEGATGPVYVRPEKEVFDYTIAMNQNGASNVLFQESFYSLANQPVVRQVVQYDGIWKSPASFRVDAKGMITIGYMGEDFRSAPKFFLIERRWHPASHDIPLPELGVQGTVTVPYVLYPGAAPSQLKLTTTSYSLPIKYGPDNTNILPYDSRITLLGPAWNPASFYHWVYSLDGISWKEFPAQFQGKHRLEVSGRDLEGEDFMNHPGANRFVKLIVDCNGAESNILTLSGRISAPNITQVTPMPDRCFATERDGACKITFSRALLVDESGNSEHLTILLSDANATHGVTLDQADNVTLDNTNSFTWPRRLQSDRQYKITLVDTYQGNNAYTGSQNSHYATVALVRPQPVSSIVMPADVHCYGGADGKIDLQAKGGVGQYRFDYVRTGTEDSVHLSLGTDTTAVALLLAPDAYFVRLRDGNGCADRAGVKRVVINQPAAALRVGYSSITHPLGYGYEDGYIETILTGGTPYADKHYTTEWYNPTVLVSDALYNNAPLSEGYKANLDSIGDGSYIVKAYDSQYTLAHPDHRAGCYTESEVFRVIQPPPIVVAVREHHYVTCHGFDDGALLASAQGGVQMPGALPYQYEWLIVEDGVTRPLTQADSIATELRSGTYRIRITDKNRVQKLSDPFFLVQPDVLVAHVTGTPVSCDSGINGTALATVQGGTLPYAYEWSDGNTTPQIGNLPTGNYFVFVTDARGCIITTSGSVPSPFPIQIDSVLRAPQCYGDGNGAIDLTVTSGTAPYRYAWSTGATTEDIEGLAQGTYNVMVTDGNNCKSYHTYILIDPAPVAVDLGGTRYLCNGQAYEADASLGAAGSTYQWTGPAGFTATHGNVTLTQAGTYHVQVTDAQGCEGEDNLELTQVALDIQAEFVVSTQAFAATEIILLNISTTPSDSVQWWTSRPAAGNYTVQEDKRAVVTFPDAGVYTLYMKAYRQGCEAVFSKTITVLGTSFEEMPKTKSSFIETFTASPVPSQGSFMVVVTMQEVSSIQLRLISLGDNKVVDERTAQGNREYALPYNLNLAAGTYLLLLESASGTALLKVLIY